MNLIILIALALILLAIYIIAYRLAKRHGTSVTEEIVGICEVAMEQTARKNENKAKILTLLQETRSTSSRQGGGLSNSDIREAFGFSPASVVRYMDELERERKVEQIGGTGRAVTYKSL